MLHDTTCYYMMTHENTWFIWYDTTWQSSHDITRVYKHTHGITIMRHDTAWYSMNSYYINNNIEYQMDLNTYTNIMIHTYIYIYTIHVFIKRYHIMLHSSVCMMLRYMALQILQHDLVDSQSWHDITYYCIH